MIYRFADLLIAQFNRRIGKSPNHPINMLTMEEFEQEYLPLRDKVRELREYL